MNLEKLKYSKCPNCKKHGISAWGKTVRGWTIPQTCKCCGKKYKVNVALNIFFKIGVIIVLGILANICNTYLFEFPDDILYIVIIIAVIGFEYFAPLEEVEESFPKYF